MLMENSRERVGRYSTLSIFSQRHPNTNDLKFMEWLILVLRLIVLFEVSKCKDLIIYNGESFTLLYRGFHNVRIDKEIISRLTGWIEFNSKVKGKLQIVFWNINLYSEISVNFISMLCECVWFDDWHLNDI